MSRILIDIEFTGLDNSYISDNEIIQLKMKNMNNGKIFIKNYGSNKELTAHVQLEHGVKKYNEPLFNYLEFEYAITSINAEFSDIYIGFGVQKDIEMLKKYEIPIENIIDIREILQRSKHEVRIATEGSGLEEIYLIATGKSPSLISHSSFDELLLIEELFHIAMTIEKNEFLSVMPHGHCAGMPISQYIEQYRRAADGYRYNNSDILSESISHWIDILEAYYDFNDSNHES